MRRVVVLAAVCALAAYATAGAAARTSADPRATIVSQLELSGNMEEIVEFTGSDLASPGPFKLHSEGLKSLVPTTGKDLKSALAHIDSATAALHTYQQDVLALPVTERPANAVAYAHQIEALAARERAFDSLAQRTLKLLDEPVLAYEVSGSATARETMRRLGGALARDMDNARAKNGAAADLAKKLPPVPKSTATWTDVTTDFAGNFPQTWTLDKNYNGTGEGGGHTFTIKSSVSGSSITMHHVYENGYTIDLKGTISADRTSMSGTFSDSNGNDGTWKATKGS